MMVTSRFEDTSFGDYDTTTGTERFPNGWYDGTVMAVTDGGTANNKKKVKIQIQLDDMPAVQRTTDVAWGEKDGKPATFVRFIASALRKPIGDPTLRAATPKTLRGKRLAVFCEWDGSVYMNIMDYALEGYRPGNGIPQFANESQAVARGNSNGNGVASEAQVQRRAQSDAAPPAQQRQAANESDRRPPARQVQTANPAAANPNNGIDAATLTPGQRRLVIVSNEIGWDEDALRSFIQATFAVELENVADAQVTPIARAMREEARQRVSA